MRPINHLSRVGMVALLFSVLGVPACFVAIDEGLIGSKGQDSSVADGGSDAPIEADAGHDAADVSIDHETDAPDDHSAADGSDSGSDVGNDTSTEAGEGGPSEGGATDGDIDPYDAPVQACYGDAWCPPVGCTLRKCEKGVCVSDGTMSPELKSFTLPSAPVVGQSATTKSVVAVHGYLVALTKTGLAVFNTRNPGYVIQEKVAPLKYAYKHLVRSGNRVWMFGDPAQMQTRVAWLDLPLDGVGVVPPAAEATLHLSRINYGFGAPNGSLYIFGSLSSKAYFFRYRPGLPTTLQSFLAKGAADGVYAVASTGNRVLMHKVYSPTSGTYQHQFSLQNNPTSSLSENTQAMTETSLTSRSSTSGYFAVSRKGAVAWIVGRRESDATWSQIRAYWLVDGVDKALQSGVYKSFEKYTTPMKETPFGPAAFVDDDTIASITKTASNGQQMLDILVRGTSAPTVLKRIPANGLFDAAVKSVAGDDGVAYLVTNDAVHVYAPRCQ